MNYRPHIDGLRAIAVLSVLGFHAGFRGFGGGFVGVDVFFVISGYLITGLLLRELEQTGELSLRRFIERRVRRLAPALFVVLVATIAAGSVLLTPVGGEQQGLAKSAIATVLLCANVYFYQHAGSYFEPPPYSLPLLHTWSLSVEEQFYLVWPWLLLLVFAVSHRFGRDANRSLVAVMAVVLLGSLAWCIHVTGEDRAAAFYLTHFRAWEFAAGALAWLAVRAGPAPARLAGAIALAGLAAVLTSVFVFREQMAFPGWIACLPVFGSAALIYGTESAPTGSMARALAIRPLVLVGLISYSLYLWHWPVFTFAKAITLEEFTPALGIALSALSIALAWATYRWIEHPIRTRSVSLMASRPRTFGVGAALAATALLAALGLGVWAKLGWPRQPGNAALAERISAIRHPDWECDSPTRVRDQGEEGDCTSDATRPASILLWGDSHAGQLKSVLADVGATQQASVRLRYKPACPPALGYAPPADAKLGRQCVAFNERVLRDLQAGTEVRTVLLGARWIGYTDSGDTDQEFARAVERTVGMLEARGLRVVIVGSGVDFPWPVPACILRRGEEECARTRTQAEARRARAQALIHGVMRAHPGVVLVDPMNALCSPERCPVSRRGIVLYSDAHHLSVLGARELVPALSRAIRGS